MNRQTWIYVLLIIAGVGLLMWILAIGTALVAPMNVAGDWVLTSAADEKAPPIKLRVEQSGRYARLSGGNFAVDVDRSGEERAKTSNTPDVIRFAGTGGEIAFSQYLNAVDIESSLPQIKGKFAASRPSENATDRGGHAR